MKEKEEDEENKIRKFAYREQTHNQTNREFKHWGHSNPLWIVGGAGQLVYVSKNQPPLTHVVYSVIKPI